MWPSSSDSAHATPSVTCSIRWRGVIATWRPAFVTEHDCGLMSWLPARDSDGPAPRDAEGVEQTLRCYGDLYDYLVVDAGSTLTASTAAALIVSDLVMLVANPDVPCLRNLQRLTDTIRLDGVAARTHAHRAEPRPSDTGVTAGRRRSKTRSAARSTFA